MLGRSYVMADYLAAIDGTGIKNSIYMEVDVDPSQQQAEAEHLIEICKSGPAPTIAAVVSGRPASGRLCSLHHAVQRQSVHQRHSAGAARRRDARRLLPARRLRSRHSAAGRAGSELRSLPAAEGTRRRREAGRKMPRHAVYRRSLRQRRSQGVFQSRRFTAGRRQPDHDADAWRRDMEQLAAQRTSSAKSAASSPACRSNGRPTTLPRSSITASTPSARSRVVFGSDWPVCLNGALRSGSLHSKQIIASRPARSSSDC